MVIKQKSKVKSRANLILTKKFQLLIYQIFTLYVDSCNVILILIPVVMYKTGIFWRPDDKTTMKNGNAILT